MNNQYESMAKIFKALSDPKRVKIIDLLSCGEMCACVLLKCFEVSQPTLSHDMRVLTEAGIVLSRKVGKNMYYSLNGELLQKMGKRIKEMCQQNSRKTAHPAQPEDCCK